MAHMAIAGPFLALLLLAAAGVNAQTIGEPVAGLLLAAPSRTPAARGTAAAACKAPLASQAPPPSLPAPFPWNQTEELQGLPGCEAANWEQYSVAASSPYCREWAANAVSAPCPVYCNDVISSVRGWVLWKWGCCERGGPLRGLLIARMHGVHRKLAEAAPHLGPSP